MNDGIAKCRFFMPVYCEYTHNCSAHARPYNSKSVCRVVVVSALVKLCDHLATKSSLTMNAVIGIAKFAYQMHYNVNKIIL